ncbi:MAG: sigma-70 family RNA polymerase sigma factor [Thermoguttaceae bacterium]|nr:sigma-70 family RNA polymerase sigma factor [Thermoguttaceae bacterium]
MDETKRERDERDELDGANENLPFPELDAEATRRIDQAASARRKNRASDWYVEDEVFSKLDKSDLREFINEVLELGAEKKMAAMARSELAKSPIERGHTNSVVQNLWIKLIDSSDNKLANGKESIKFDDCKSFIAYCRQAIFSIVGDMSRRKAREPKQTSDEDLIADIAEYLAEPESSGEIDPERKAILDIENASVSRNNWKRSGDPSAFARLVFVKKLVQKMTFAEIVDEYNRSHQDKMSESAVNRLFRKFSFELVKSAFAGESDAPSEVDWSVFYSRYVDLENPEAIGDTKGLSVVDVEKSLRRVRDKVSERFREVRLTSSVFTDLFDDKKSETEAETKPN